MLYFTVTSELLGLPDQLRHLHIITASSKGDRSASIILPHLFYYQSPGFTADGGRLIWKQGGLLRQETSPTPKGWHTWPFHGYRGHTHMPIYGNTSKIKALPRSLHETQDGRVTIAFVGDLAGRPCRLNMHQAVKHNVIFAKYGPRDLCSDPSVPGGLALCWRSFMLQADINLAPIGTHPVSYRLFEALQQGSIPVHVYDQRGVFLPYAGTDADIHNGLGFVVPFAGLRNLTDWLQSDAFGPKDVIRMRQKILKYRDTHFTAQGVVLQLKKFFESGGLDKKSDIRCCVAIPEGPPCG